MVSSVSGVNPYQDAYMSVGQTQGVGASESVSSSNSTGSSQQANDAADLNKDGTVTQEEAIKYMQMQMMEKMSEDMMSMADENSQSSQQHLGDNNKPDPKMKQAAGAYSSVQNSLNAYEGTAIFV